MLGITPRLLAAISLIVFAFPASQLAYSAPDVPPAAKAGIPANPQAAKTYQTALDWLKLRRYELAILTFRKAARQDGHCHECLRKAYSYANEIGNYKEAEEIAREWLPIAEDDRDRAAIHYRLALALQRQGMDGKNDKCFSESCDEFKAALQLQPRLDLVHYSMGISLAHMHQDDAARTEFSDFLQHDNAYPDIHERAERYRDRVELARARMTPPFTITTLDGQRLSLDSLAGKVVLIDFWATWCGPCRAALPNLKYLAHEFQEQPFVLISISVDKDEKKWKEFVAKNQMTWPQYRDGSFDGTIATAFGIRAIPATFTIDADGVLEDQHVGDVDIEKKLKRLVSAAQEQSRHKPSGPALQPAHSQTVSPEKLPGEPE